MIEECNLRDELLGNSLEASIPVIPFRALLNHDIDGYSWGECLLHLKL
jgi:hypothetical protein